GGLSVRSLAVAPSDSNYVVVGTANDDPKRNGVFLSKDAGKSWDRISPVGDKEIHNIESAAFDPKDTNIIYAGTWHLAWKTLDGGTSWKPTGYKETGVLDDSDIFGITVNPINPKLLYLNACSGIYRSTSAGEKWIKIPGIPFSARRTYALLPHPVDGNIIFAGTSEGLWRSKDGGKRWTLLTSKSVVIRSIVVSPEKPTKVFIATDDFGVRVSDNLGDDFADANTGFIHRHILAILPDSTERGRILASVFHDGSGGSIFASADGGQSWQPSSKGLGSRDVFALYQMPDNPEIIYAGTNTGVFRSSDRGANWTYVGHEQPVKPDTPARKPVKNRRASAAVSVGRYQTIPVQKRTSASSKSKGKPRAKTEQKKPGFFDAVPLAPGFVELNKQVDDISSFVDQDGRRGLLAATMSGL